MKQLIFTLVSTLILSTLLSSQSVLNNPYESAFVNEYLEIINKRQAQPINLPTFNGPKQKMDSVITQVYSSFQWVNQTKTRHTYDHSENEVSRITYKWDISIDQWVANKKFIKTFDTNGNHTFYYEQEWNSNLDSWIPIALDEFTFDQHDQLISKVVYRSWNPTAKNWKNGYRYTYYYRDGNLTEEIRSEIDLATRLWKFKSVDKYTYNLNNDPITKQSLVWNDKNELFEAKYLDEINYVNDRLSRTVRHLWLGHWKPIVQLNYDYGTDGFLDQMRLLTWSSFTSSWEVKRKNVLDYNYKGTLIENQAYITVGGNWMGTSKFNKEYDSVGNHDCLTLYDWNAAAQVWTNKRKSTSSFDLSTSISELITPFDIGEDRHKKTVDSSQVWSSFLNDWSTTERKFYYYSFESLVTTDNQEPKSTKKGQVYPNPVHDVLNFDYSFTSETTTVFFYQTDGKLAYTTTLRNNRVNLSDLTSGIYIYRIIDGQHQYSGRIIKQ